jgi:hypothetical protein
MKAASGGAGVAAFVGGSAAAAPLAQGSEHLRVRSREPGRSPISHTGQTALWCSVERQGASMVWRRLVASVLLGACTFAGCTSLQTIRPAVPGEAPFGPVQAGDTVLVQTRAGDQVFFVVQRIDGEALMAPNGRRYERSDLVRVQRKAISGPKTTALIAGIAGGVLIVVALTVGKWLGENSQ